MEDMTTGNSPTPAPTNPAEWVAALVHDSIDLFVRTITCVRTAVVEWTTPPQQQHEAAPLPAAGQTAAPASAEPTQPEPSNDGAAAAVAASPVPDAAPLFDTVASDLAASAESSFASALSAAASSTAAAVSAALLSAHTAVADGYDLLASSAINASASSEGWASSAAEAANMASASVEELYLAATWGVEEQWRSSGLGELQWEADSTEVIVLIVVAHVLVLSLLYALYYFCSAAQLPKLYSQHASAGPRAIATQRPPVQIDTSASSALSAVAHSVSPAGRLGRVLSQRYYPAPALSLPFLSGHLQTIYTARATPRMLRTPLVTYKRELLRVEAGSEHTLPGQVALDWAVLGKARDASPLVRAAEWQRAFTDTTPTVIICHGLAGGSAEHYVKNTIWTLSQPPHNFRCVVFNARGCGGTELISPQLYCGAYTDDLRQVVANVRARLPRAPLLAVGFSLGANILSKFLGEEGMAGRSPPFAAAVAVANPFDFLNGARYLERNVLQKWLYSRNLAANLIRLFKTHMHVLDADGARAKAMQQPGPVATEPALHVGRAAEAWDLRAVFSSPTLREFDKRLTRIVFGYATVDDYYRDASSSRVVKFIHTPTLFLNALDDPISAPAGIPYDECSINPFVTLVTTPTGGHSMDHFEAGGCTSWTARAIAAFLADVVATHGAVGNQARAEPIGTPPPHAPALADEFLVLSSSGGFADASLTDGGALFSPASVSAPRTCGVDPASVAEDVGASLQAELELQRRLEEIEQALQAQSFEQQTQMQQ